MLFSEGQAVWILFPASETPPIRLLETTQYCHCSSWALIQDVVARRKRAAWGPWLPRERHWRENVT